MSIVLSKPVSYQGEMKQVSIFQQTDNYNVFKFSPTVENIAPYQSRNVDSKWNDKHVSAFELVGENQKVLATKTIPAEIIEGVVNSAKIDKLQLWIETGTGANKKEVFNDKIKYSCKAGVLTCLGEV